MRSRLRVVRGAVTPATADEGWPGEQGRPVPQDGPPCGTVPPLKTRATCHSLASVLAGRRIVITARHLTGQVRPEDDAAQPLRCIRGDHKDDVSAALAREFGALAVAHRLAVRE